MSLIIMSFIAWLLTILAPCVLPVLPVILGGTLGSQNKWKPIIITVSFAISVIIFTLLLKLWVTNFWFNQTLLEHISGSILIIFGVFLIFPIIWDYISVKSGLEKSSGLLSKFRGKSWVIQDIFLWGALGPVFNSCSPTYLIIVAIILPANFIQWFTSLLAYTLWLSIMLLLIGYGWMKITSKLRIFANPNWWAKKILGILIVVTGILIFTWYQKKLETKLLDLWSFDKVLNIEQELLEKVDNDKIN